MGSLNPRLVGGSQSAVTARAKYRKENPPGSGGGGWPLGQVITQALDREDGGGGGTVKKRGRGKTGPRTILEAAYNKQTLG